MKKSLSETEWVEAALSALAQEGLAAVAVEPLARRLSVTKGSFYWHFRDRSELVQKTLEEWERRATLEVIAALDPLPPRERLQRLLHNALNPAADRHYLALTAAASDPQVQQVLNRVSQRRLDYLAVSFEQLGLHPAEAAQRAYLVLAAYVGFKHLTRELGRHEPEGYERHLIDTLIHTVPY